MAFFDAFNRSKRLTFAPPTVDLYGNSRSSASQRGFAPFANWQQALWNSPIGQRTMFGMRAAGLNPVGFNEPSFGPVTPLPVKTNPAAAESYAPSVAQRSLAVGTPTEKNDRSVLSRLAGGSPSPVDVSMATDPVIPAPRNDGSTHWQDVLAANNGDERLATRAWNRIQAQASGFSMPRGEVGRIIGWNWGEPIYAGQRSPGGYTGYGPGGVYTPAPRPSWLHSRATVLNDLAGRNVGKKRIA